jgi:hypothetical protein
MSNNIAKVLTASSYGVLHYEMENIAKQVFGVLCVK